MAVSKIPLSPQAQTFNITLNGVVYILNFSWNTAPTGGWVMDIFDENDNPIATGLPLVTGADLLAQLQYLGIDGSLEVQTTFDLDAVPTFENLGITSNLYFITGGSPTA